MLINLSNDDQIKKMKIDPFFFHFKTRSDLENFAFNVFYNKAKEPFEQKLIEI